MGRKTEHLSEAQKAAIKIENEYCDKGFDRVKKERWIELVARIGKNLRDVKFIGSGGEGWTLVGSEDGFEHRPIVIKIFRPSFVVEPLAPERIRRTSIIQDKLSLSLTKSKVPRIISSSHDSWSVAYTMMDFVEGETLFKATRGRSEEDIINIFLKVCEAVIEFHNETIVHRDLKPENIILTPKGEIAFFDWGSSFEMTDLSRLTCTGFSLASARYGSEEQLAGFANHCDVRSDIYSLACIMTSLVTGYEADCLMSKNEGRWFVRDRFERYLPDNLLQVYNKATSKDKQDRHRNTNIFLEDVRLAAAQDGIIQDPEVLKRTQKIEMVKRNGRRIKSQRVEESFEDYESRSMQSWTDALKLVRERRGK